MGDRIYSRHVWNHIVSFPESRGGGERSVTPARAAAKETRNHMTQIWTYDTEMKGEGDGVNLREGR